LTRTTTPVVLSCDTCGDRWTLNVPKKFRTDAFVQFALIHWKKKHQKHRWAASPSHYQPSLPLGEVGKG